MLSASAADYGGTIGISITGAGDVYAEPGLSTLGVGGWNVTRTEEFDPEAGVSSGFTDPSSKTPPAS